jgi:hypothetical protein
MDKEKGMTKSLNRFISVLTLLSILALGSNARKAQAQAPSRYPILDAVADKVVQRYQASTCEQLWEKKSQKAPPKPEEQRLIQMLHGDPDMRAAFINKVAAPIANKMFECGMIP